jgi:hypothetical protein
MEDLFVLLNEGHLRRVNTDTLDIYFKKIFRPPVHHLRHPRERVFKEITRSRLPGKVRLERYGDELLVNGTRFSQILENNIHMHPNVGVALFHFQDKFFPRKYMHDGSGRRRRIIFRGAAFRGSPEEAVWFALEEDRTVLVGDLHPVGDLARYKEWEPIV